MRHELDVVLLERAVERAGDDRTLAGIGVLRRDCLAQIRTVGELAVDVGQAELPAGLVGLGPRPVEVSAPQALLQQVPLPPTFPPPRPRSRERGALVVGQVALAFRHDPARARAGTRRAAARSARSPARPAWPTNRCRPPPRPCPPGRVGAPIGRCGTWVRRSRRGPATRDTAARSGNRPRSRARGTRRRCRRPKWTAQTWRSSSHVADVTVTPSRRCARRSYSSTVSSRYFCNSGCLACVRVQSLGLNEKQ